MRFPSFAAASFRPIASLATAAALALTMLTGCGSDKPGWVSLNPNDWSIQRQADDPLVLDLEGPISLDIDTFAGDVTIEGDPDLSAGEVVIIREGRHGFGRRGESKASFADITASVEIVAADTSRGELGQTLRIRTETVSAEPHFQRAHVRVKAPAIEGLTVRTNDGDVTIKHVEGMADVESNNGTVSLRTNLAMNKPVTIINRNGDIIFRSNPDSAGAFDAETITGKVKTDFRYGAVKVESATRDNMAKATLNGGTNRMIFRTTNGDINIGIHGENERAVIQESGRKPPEEKPLVEPEPATQPE